MTIADGAKIVVSPPGGEPYEATCVDHRNSVVWLPRPDPANPGYERLEWVPDCWVTEVQNP